MKQLPLNSALSYSANILLHLLNLRYVVGMVLNIYMHKFILSFQQPYDIGIFVISILRMRKLRCSEVE